MKLSELIKQLQEIEKKKGGDILCLRSAIRWLDLEYRNFEVELKPIEEIKQYVAGFIAIE